MNPNRTVSVSPTMRAYIAGSSLRDAPDDYGPAGATLLAKLAASKRTIDATPDELVLLVEFAQDLLYFASEGDGTSTERRAARRLLDALT